jgi:hypothetical protein
MHQNEVAFLLRLLNSMFPDGREPDSVPAGMIIHRFLSFGLTPGYSRLNGKWFCYPNTDSIKWKEEKE